MKIKLTQKLPARQIHLAVLAAGSVIEIDDRIAVYLVGRGKAEEVKASKKHEETAEPDKPKAKK